MAHAGILSPPGGWEVNSHVAAPRLGTSRLRAATKVGATDCVAKNLSKKTRIYGLVVQKRGEMSESTAAKNKAIDVSFVRSGCVGSYVMPQIGIPRGASSATNLVLDIKNEFPMDIHSKNSRPKKVAAIKAARDGDSQSKQFVRAACA